MRNYLDVKNVAPRHLELYKECSKYIVSHPEQEKIEGIRYTYKPMKLKYNNRYNAWMQY